MSELVKLLDKAAQAGKYSPIEQLILMNRNKNNETAEAAANELSILRDENRIAHKMAELLGWTQKKEETE